MRHKCEAKRLGRQVYADYDMEECNTPSYTYVHEWELRNVSKSKSRCYYLCMPCAQALSAILSIANSLVKK